MRRILHRAAALGALAAACLFCAGCSFRLVASPEELYTLPQLPAEYTELDGMIQTLLQDGAEYAAPTYGTNVQPVQLVDLDGDGQEEALAFLRKSADEKPLKIYVFEKTGQGYENSAVIESTGTAIYSILYYDLDGDGRQELVAGWKIGTELQALTVYALRGGEPRELMRTSYVKYAATSLGGGVSRELTVFHADDQGGGAADYYTLQQDGTLQRTSGARLSMTMAELNSGRIVQGRLNSGAPALFVTGVTEGGEAVTDILADRQGELTNISLSGRTGVSTEIYRFLSLYPQDINADGTTEVPAPQRLPAFDPEAESAWRVDWCSYDDSGAAAAAASTYHDMADGWYLMLPQSWTGRITITREQPTLNEAAVTFSFLGEDGERLGDFLRIYTITGSGRAIEAVRGSRFILSRQAETIYAAELLPGGTAWEYGVTEDELCGRFSLILSEWTGEN